MAKCKQLARRNSSGSLPDQPHQEFPDTLVLSGCESNLQEQLLRHAASQSQSRQLPDTTNPAVKALLEGKRNLGSEAVQQHSFSNTDLRRIGCVVVESSGYLWGVFLQRIAEMLGSGEWLGLAFGLKRRYDETPLSLRVTDALAESTGEGSACFGPTSGGRKRTAKVMQTELYLSVLVEHVRSGRCIQVMGKVPTWLQCLQTTKAEQIAETQQKLLGIIPNLLEVSKSFLLRHNFVCTDRFSANLSAEQLIKMSLGLSSTHGLCQVHKLSASEKSMSQILAGHIGGIVSLSLSMRSAGSVRELQEALFGMLSEELRVCVGAPQCEAQRRAIYKLFLPDSSETDTCVGARAARRGSNPALAFQKRALVLDHFLNGDISSDAICHWVPVYRDRGEVLAEMKKYLVPALVPGACPVLNRGKWLGAECTFRLGPGEMKLVLIAIAAIAAVSSFAHLRAF
eukprot:Skav201253  [mRNA]  locus=scaffold1492:61058:62422:+ [translate_table: standard]